MIWQCRTGQVESINVSHGGVPKEPVAEALITAFGLNGDQHRDLRHHGGPDRAVVLYSLELIEALAREGHQIRPGSAGENLTISGIEWTAVVPGAKLRIEEVRLEITKFASPCHIIAGSFRDGDPSRVSQALHPGWSRVCARVLSGGLVRVGDAIALVD